MNDVKLSQQGQTYSFDVIVIGTGLAGLSYCLELIRLQPHIKIALISKTEAFEGSSVYAQGGIAAAMSSEDSVESHIQDTHKAGDGLCYEPAVEFIVRQAPQIIEKLDHYQVNFDKDQAGQYALAKEGGHAHRRILHSGDETGKNVIHTLIKVALEARQITLFEHHIAINLITQCPAHRIDIQGEVVGAYVLDTHSHKIHTFLSNVFVLATGGAGKTYQYTSNPMVATGDGVAMAYRAGARVGNMEFYQFHPTLLHHPEVNNFLISEAVRGEGARLLNADTNERFMHHYAPESMELATRDIVARGIFNEIEKSDKSFVYLDITHHSSAFLKKRFPKIYTTLLSLGIDMSQDYIPVVPAAHYQCGGILTDLDGRTDLKRLYAIGEVAFTGLHGANRLASNALLEALVMGTNAAFACLKDLSNPIKLKTEVYPWSAPYEINPRRASQINSHWRSLRGEMTSYAGIIRTEEGLSDLHTLIRSRQRFIEEYYWHHKITRDFIELKNIMITAELIVKSALARRESRGGHYREDYPQKDSHPKESIARSKTIQHLINEV